ncbi:secreted trypsin-like serine protease [Crossiella equi]|uniref:Secreted trypsin-like serine protease n=1 Tax=Crossiella equi TaxID=130796 RepID=A0ABS5AQ33_9PSEU|nr:trypsin-like serine protease [Crossiella equi]MBP2478679.1 secreted trypsin-like serine protease [Crossiella equi]
MRARSLLAAVLTGAAALAGLATPAAADSAEALIVKGEFTASAPWSARLYQDGKDGYCTATVIADSWIITARHCIGGDHQWGFRIGDVEHAKGTYVDVVPGGITIHPNADLALAKLAKPVPASAQRVRLGTLADVAVNQTVTIHGWGQTEAGTQSPRLKNAKLKVTNLSARDAYDGRAVNGAQINGVCGSGDSGGPMFAPNGTQVGVLSTGDGRSCQYTHVGAYREWIKSIAGV